MVPWLNIFLIVSQESPDSELSDNETLVKNNTKVRFLAALFKSKGTSIFTSKEITDCLIVVPGKRRNI